MVRTGDILQRRDNPGISRCLVLGDDYRWDDAWYSVLTRWDGKLSDRCIPVFRNDSMWEVVKEGDGTSGLDLVLVTGARDWSDETLVEKELRELMPRRLLQGGASGADKIAKKKGEALGIPVDTIKAEWEKHGDPAGPIRNGEMLKRAPALVLAFHDNLNESRGTVNMMSQARAGSVPVKLVCHRKSAGLSEYM